MSDRQQTIQGNRQGSAQKAQQDRQPGACIDCQTWQAIEYDQDQPEACPSQQGQQTGHRQPFDQEKGRNIGDQAHQG